MRFYFVLLTTLTTFQALAEPAKPTVEWGLFVDTYYAFDANRPLNGERAFTTLPTRDNEFALNLAFIESKLTTDRLRGRFALQTGTSVYANYAAEKRDPTKPGMQLADLLEHVQEATVGYCVAEGLWVDAGIFFSHIGSEGFISRDNWTYTRSLIADFSPYYQAGVKLTYDPNAQWSLQLHVLNGWQNILENNSDKVVGTQIVFRPGAKFAITHNSLIGRETEFRLFQDLIFKFQPTAYWESAFTFDLGFQRRPGQSMSSWLGTSFQNRFRLSDATHLAVRVENYADPDGVIAPTGTPANFQAVGASVNVDQKLTPGVTWRNEVRWIHAKDAIFPSNQSLKHDTVFGVTSLALSL